MQLEIEPAFGGLEKAVRKLQVVTPVEPRLDSLHFQPGQDRKELRPCDGEKNDDGYHKMSPLVRPPGPKNRGVIGNFPMGSKDPLGTYTKWARQYGDIFHFRAFSRHIYFINSPDYAQYVLATNYKDFIKGEALRFNRRIFGNGLLTNEGESWLQNRRLIQPAFRHDRIASYGNTMVAYAERLLEGWHDGEVRDIHADMMRVGLEIAAKVLFDVEVAAEKERISEALDTVTMWNAGGRMLLPPIFRRIPTPGNLRYERAVRQLDEIVYRYIGKRQEDGHAGTDLLGVLLQAQHEGEPMSDEQLRDEVMTLLIAGHETTAISLSWAWYLLARNPEVEEKLWSELRDVLDGRSPNIQDLPRLSYTDCVIKEAMRLYPPVWAVVRNSLVDCELGGYRVPAGATIMVSQWVTHRDPRYFDEPEQFEPDRWLRGNEGGAKFIYFPFGAGPRACIGASFAVMESVLILATIAQRFQIRVSTDAPVQPLPTMTLRPKNGINIVLTRRKERR
jgi:cytochrome P450